MQCIIIAEVFHKVKAFGKFFIKYCRCFFNPRAGLDGAPALFREEQAPPLQTRRARPLHFPKYAEEFSRHCRSKIVSQTRKENGCGRIFGRSKPLPYKRQGRVRCTFRNMRKNFQGIAAAKLFRRRGKKMDAGAFSGGASPSPTNAKVASVALSDVCGRIFKALPQ